MGTSLVAIALALLVLGVAARPAVPSTGSAGLAGSAASTSASGVLLLGLLAAGLAVGARRLTREGRS